MSEYTNFVAMTRSEAGTFLDVFVDEMEQSLSKFAETVKCDLTFSPGSLEAVWSSMRPQLGWRSGFTPPAIGQPGQRVNAEQIEPPADLPSWFHHPSAAGYARFSRETIWLIDGASRYLGETFVRTRGGRWSSGDSQEEGYVYQNQPVLTDAAADPLSPMQTCAVLVARALRSGPKQGVQDLAEVYDAWCARAQ